MPTLFFSEITTLSNKDLYFTECMFNEKFDSL